ncbi:sulfotransferase [Zavarzinia sp. CC-PAN008]|uniref:tetratricopeptide repeat-containing sulfotransferase family protein n=1 Tax=Zavarzinia sp. CC-PAN008 TaxID=3243332 RepID=UPI003F743499
MDPIEEAGAALRAGDLARAERLFRAGGDDPRALHGMGIVALQRGDARGASRLLGQAVQRRPNDPALLSDFGTACLMAGEARAAVQGFSRLVQVAPRSAEAQFNLGCALGLAQRPAEAEAAYRRALALEPGRRDAANNLGGVLQAQGRVAEAVVIWQEALARQPDDPELLANMAHGLEMLNRLQEAEDACIRLLALVPDHAPILLLRARLARRRGDLAIARAGFDALLRGRLAPALEAEAHAELAQVLDKLGEARPAFRAVARANALRTTLLQGFDPARARRHAQAMAAWWRPGWTAGRQQADDPIDPAPVFFVGFPRSGTTLMEEMLAAHPALATTGERSPLEAVLAPLRQGLASGAYPASLEALDAGEVAALRRGFREETARILGPQGRAKRLVDKLPLNLIDLGAIELLLPEARVLVALRDPRDVCLSCFMQDFEPNDAMANFLDLGSTAAFYADVMGLWLRYRDGLALPVLDYRYEDLIGDVAGTVRRVLDFIGEPFDPAVLTYRDRMTSRYVATPSRDAVTQPINRKAIGRWHAYAEDLAPILPVLAPFVEAFGYEV